MPVGAAFTANLLAAAPVQVCRAHLLKSGGLSAGVILNSGCANAATGSEGRVTSELTCDLAAEALGVRPEHFLVCSTGTIGTRLAGERIKAALPLLIGGRGSSREHATAAAKAILTTDTRTKEVVIEAKGFTVGGMAKGAAMLSPNMATMLAVLTTDASSSSQTLNTALSQRGPALVQRDDRGRLHVDERLGDRDGKRSGARGGGRSPGRGAHSRL